MSATTRDNPVAILADYRSKSHENGGKPRVPSPRTRRARKSRENLARNTQAEAFILAQRTWETEFRDHAIIELNGHRREPLTGWIEHRTLFARYVDWHAVTGQDGPRMSIRAFCHALNRIRVGKRRRDVTGKRDFVTERYVKHPHVAMHGVTMQPVEDDLREVA